MTILGGIVLRTCNNRGLSRKKVRKQKDKYKTLSIHVKTKCCNNDIILFIIQMRQNCRFAYNNDFMMNSN